MYYIKFLFPLLIFAFFLSCSPVSRNKKPTDTKQPGVSVKYVKENPMNAHNSEKSSGKA